LTADVVPSDIRRATPADIDAIVQLTNQAFIVEAYCIVGDRTNRDDINARFETGAFLVIDDCRCPGALLGSVFVSIENQRGYLGLLAVAPTAQGKGLARELIAAVASHCLQANCDALDITVVSVRHELFAFYEKHGFARDGVTDFPVPEKMLQPLHLVKLTKPLR
jgi:ribosomal protein S18 acetylase RimI-like enzyme